MKKTMKIEGMSCNHCKAAVERFLNALPGVKASADFQTGIALIDVNGNISDEQLREAITVNTPFKVLGIE